MRPERANLRSERDDLKLEKPYKRGLRGTNRRCRLWKLQPSRKWIINDDKQNILALTSIFSYNYAFFFTNFHHIFSLPATLAVLFLIPAAQHCYFATESVPEGLMDE